MFLVEDSGFRYLLFSGQDSAGSVGAGREKLSAAGWYIITEICKMYIRCDWVCGVPGM